MNKSLPIFLWTLVGIFGGVTFFLLNGDRFKKSVESDGRNVEVSQGAAYADIPWKHFQHVPPFQLTNQEDEVFDSASLMGRPYVVSFFFAECPTICRDLNKQIQTLRERVNDSEMAFLSISVDPENDTPDKLNRYAADFDADVSDWQFLTGAMYKVKEVGEQTFRVIVDKFTHTDNILLVDRWGRYRDRFKWDDPYDMKRFLQVAKEVLAETEPPLDKVVHTRNMMASVVPTDYDVVPWIRDFHLTDQGDEPFFSRDLIGEVWIGNFFFTSCPGICVQQNEYLAGLQKRLADHPAKIISITTDPGTDTPQALRRYAEKVGADLTTWNFLTGKSSLIKRISGEFFKAPGGDGHHSSRLFVVDRWGQVRGDFDWQNAGEEVEMFQLIDKLNQETKPAAKQ